MPPDLRPYITAVIDLNFYIRMLVERDPMRTSLNINDLAKTKFSAKGLP